jgi:hypothetical protein
MRAGWWSGSAAVILPLVVCLLTGSGCWGPKRPAGLALQGRILKGGAAIPLDPALVEVAAAFVSVEMQRCDEAGTLVFTTSVQTTPDGTFEVRGLEPGTYKIGVTCRDGSPDELFRGRLATERSGISIDVTADMPPVEIELDEYLDRPRRKP